MTDLRPVTSVEPLVDREGLAEILGMSIDVIDDMRVAGMPSIRWGRKLVRFQPSRCMAWLESQQGEAA